MLPTYYLILKRNLKCTDLTYSLCFANDSAANEFLHRKYHVFKENNSKFTEGGYESSYSSRRSNQYSTDGYSSRHKSELSSGKYDSSNYSIGGGSKYDSIASKYNRDTDDTTGLTSSYSSRKPSSTDDENYSFSRKTVRSSAVGASDDGTSYSYSRRISSGTERDTDPYSSYTRKSARSVTRTDEDYGDGDTYSYTTRSVKSSLDESKGGDGYSVSKYSRTSLTGTGIDPVDIKDSTSYSSKRYLESDVGSKYSSRSVSIEEGDHKRNRSLRGDGEEYISKYSNKYSTEKILAEDNDDDKYAKYKRKYSRTDSLSDKKAIKEDDEDKYSRRYSRTSSRDKQKSGEEEEDAYERYAKKYLRKESTVEQSEISGKLESDNLSSKSFSHSYVRSPSETEDVGKYKVRNEDTNLLNSVISYIIKIPKKFN